jgi:hypothetical protein
MHTDFYFLTGLTGLKGYMFWLSGRKSEHTICLRQKNIFALHAQWNFCPVKYEVSLTEAKAIFLWDRYADLLWWI